MAEIIFSWIETDITKGKISTQCFLPALKCTELLVKYRLL